MLAIAGIDCPSIVLCSGGVDSVTLAANLRNSGAYPTLCFVDYNQPARRAERRSAAWASGHLGLKLRQLCLRGFRIPTVGEIPARNSLLITAALAAFPDCRLIGIGI